MPMPMLYTFVTVCRVLSVFRPVYPIVKTPPCTIDHTIKTAAACLSAMRHRSHSSGMHHLCASNCQDLHWFVLCTLGSPWCSVYPLTAVSACLSPFATIRKLPSLAPLRIPVYILLSQHICTYICMDMAYHLRFISTMRTVYSVGSSAYSTAAVAAWCHSCRIYMIYSGWLVASCMVNSGR